MKSNGLVLGILGGMGPAASAELYSLISRKAPAQIDQEHPRIIIDSDTSIPNRTDFILGKGADPSPFLLAGLNRLLSWGADVLAVPCNTSAYFIDSFPAWIRSRIISIVDETIDRAKMISSRGAWLTATLGTMRTEIYQRHASYRDYLLKVPSECQMQIIHHITDLVKKGDVLEAGVLYKDICAALLDEEDIPIIGACTELPLAYSVSGLDQKKFISSLESLADACLRELYK